MIMNKYPVHKLAKDFTRNSKALPSKEIMDILTQYGHPPKNHMQPLTDLELSIVFEYLTQHNQIDSIEQVYADVYHEPEAKKEPAPKAAEPAKDAPKGEKKDHAPQQGQTLVERESLSRYVVGLVVYDAAVGGRSARHERKGVGQHVVVAPTPEFVAPHRAPRYGEKRLGTSVAHRHRAFCSVLFHV